jgi:hypothetical protein
MFLVHTLGHINICRELLSAIFKVLMAIHDCLDILIAIFENQGASPTGLKGSYATVSVVWSEKYSTKGGSVLEAVGNAWSFLYAYGELSSKSSKRPLRQQTFCLIQYLPRDYLSIASK